MPKPKSPKPRMEPARTALTTLAATLNYHPTALQKIVTQNGIGVKLRGYYLTDDEVETLKRLLSGKRKYAGKERSTVGQ